jgi:phosphopantothenoylcysteine synthetase/decarboxylase
VRSSATIAIEKWALLFATAAAARSAKVTLITRASQLANSPWGHPCGRVTSALEMEQTVQQCAAQQNIFIAYGDEFVLKIVKTPTSAPVCSNN